MAVAAFGSASDAPGGVDGNLRLTWLSQRLTTFRDSEVEMQNRVDASETAVDDADDIAFPPRTVPECCALSFFVLTLTYSVERCWVTRLRA